MKIAITGKGGSGKSTVSWLISNYLSAQNKKVLAIDADHNMDLASNFGLEITGTVPLFFRADREIRSLIGMQSSGKWAEYFLCRPLQLNLNSEIIEKYTVNIRPNLNCIIMGLGEEKIMYLHKCAHGLSSHLKYILPTLEVKKDEYVIIDSVAGSDMLNYGLYFGCDVICTVVEGHTNSIKVANQLKKITEEQGLKIYFILNKYDPENQLTQQFESENRVNILGYISPDLSIMDYHWEKITEKTQQELTSITNRLDGLKTIPDQEKYEMLKRFEETKQPI